MPTERTVLCRAIASCASSCVDPLEDGSTASRAKPQCRESFLRRRSLRRCVRTVPGSPGIISACWRWETPKTSCACKASLITCRRAPRVPVAQSAGRPSTRKR